MHALWALESGFEVVQMERELEARGASVRNFGLVWVGGRAAGEELALALRARTLWEEIAGRVSGLDFRPVGSLTVALGDAELSLMKEASQTEDAGRRGWELLDSRQAREVNPELSPLAQGALYCRSDAIVEPRLAVGALRAHLREQGGYQWLPGRLVTDLAERAVRDDRGEWHHADMVYLCTGAVHSGVLRQHLGAPRTRKVRLQMLETHPYPGTVTTALADADSMRYYPAFDLPERSSLAAQAEIAANHSAQLLVVQRLDGSLTIGDTHDYEEPFPFDVEEEIYDYLLDQTESLLRRPLPGVRRRWAGVYSEMVEKDAGLYWREEVLHGVEVVSGPGGRGMTCSPAIAEDSFARFLGESAP